MPKATMTLGGREVRVEINWNTLSAFLADVGRDTLEGLSTISVMKPSEIPALMAAAINEGERLEGRESNLKAKDVGALIKPADVTTFMNIYVEQSRAQMEVDEPKKGAGRIRRVKAHARYGPRLGHQPPRPEP